MTDEQREFLMKLFGVTYQMTWYALNFYPKKGESDLAKKIRKVALERGGFVVCTLPESEVVHDSEGMMRQWFASGMMWECDKKTGEVRVKDRQGMTVETLSIPGITQLEALQARLRAGK